LSDGGDEDGEGDGEHTDGLVLDSLDLKISIPEVSDDGCKTDEVPNINGSAYTDT